MKPIQRTRKSSKFEPDDYINSMPDNVVTNILDRLPLQEAARTGILAKNWRFKWTLLSQLVFDENFYQYLVKTKREKNYGTMVTRLLLHLKGVITKFVIHIGKQCCSVLNDEDIYHWVFFLSRNGIKDLTFDKCYEAPLKLPIHLFSCMELRRLVLTNCCFDPPPGFHGFPNLLSLELENLRLEIGKFGQFFTHCPILEILKMGIGITCYPDRMQLDEIAKLTNLKTLSVCLFTFDTNTISNAGIFGLPKLQELHLNFKNCKFTVENAQKGFPITFPSFKTLDLSNICLGTGMTISGAFEITRSFMNLHSLEIRETNWNIVPTPDLPEVDYNATRLLQLRSAVFGFFIGSEEELRFIEYLLGSSPFLKKIVIHFRGLSASDKNKFARKLLKFHRASHVAEIDLCLF